MKCIRPDSGGSLGLRLLHFRKMLSAPAESPVRLRLEHKVGPVSFVFREIFFFFFFGAVLFSFDLEGMNCFGPVKSNPSASRWM
jgi:hypothetical protein